ncbi:hypothetical protein PH91_05610 [Salmonella enterica subsp. enterica]|nr:hypothetical protein [Salmonella enterica subsp. enterica]EDT2869545.1 hypothetical protein [Salmonella enterica subsp. enterica serovar Bere]EDV0347656.1 hypothetical protein [Salmonella enterica subsp. enterica]EEJ0350673.1 hypothetical protein [Salmonella enterica subsp. enterica]EEJ2508791.1 hypothetical protein [Salmonella enterica subsp. arizonae serovar 47:z4,z23:-]
MKVKTEKRGLRGTAVLEGGWTGKHAGGYWLVPSYANKWGGQDYDWENALPTRYPTQRAALNARKEMRQQGLLP